MSNCEIRAKARAIRKTTEGMLLLFMPPVLLSLLSNMFSNYLRSAYGWAGIPIFHKAVGEFGSVRSFEIHFEIKSLFDLFIDCLIVTACFQLIRVIRKEGSRLGFMDCFNRLDEKNFLPLLITVVMRGVLRLLCGIPMLIGASLISWYVVEKGVLLTLYMGFLPDFSDFFSSSNVQLGLLLLLLGGLVTAFIGYGLSLVEFLLYDHLEIGTYSSPVSLFKQSWQLMKGKRWRLFLLDLSFIGWFIGIFLTMGLLAIYVYPYYWTCRVLFYEDLKARHPLVFKGLFSESRHIFSSSAVQYLDRNS